MPKKLFIGNLPFNISEDELREYFAEAGTVNSVQIISDRATGRSQGFGFVEMESEDEASKAVRLLDGKDLTGRRIKVQMSGTHGSGGGVND